ncbi:ATPase [Caballeronia catudaia]|nr:ATPase [Caballeronia catudaia]
MEKKMRRIIALIIALLLGMLLSGCGGGDSSTAALSSTTKSSVEEASAQDKSTVKGYALSTVIWKQIPIGVCWDMSSADFAQYAKERSWTRLAVQESWEEHSSVEFAGWQQCTNDPSFYGIRISVEDIAGSGPHTRGLGAMLNNVVGGMALNFTFANWSPSCRGREEYCIRNVAAHEFGHALGFAHEQNRPDTPSTCKEPAQGTIGDTMIGAWDLASVMNYCNPEWNGNGKLSATDIAMAQKYYGVPLLKGSFYVGKTWTSAPAKVVAYDASTLAEKATFEFPDHSFAGIFSSGDGTRAHVALRKALNMSYYVATIDTATNKVLSMTDELITSSSADNDLLPSLDGRQFYVAESRDSAIGIIDTDSGKATKRIVLSGYSPRKFATAKDDRGSLYVLADNSNTWPRMREILRVDLASGAITRSYPAGFTPLGNPSTYYKKPELAATPDAKKAYFVLFTAPAEGNLTELDLASGTMRTLTDLPVIKPTFLSAATNEQILFGDDSSGNPNLITLYDVSKRKTTPLLTATYLQQVQYEPRTRSIFHANGVSSYVNQLRPLATGDGYSNTDLRLFAPVHPQTISFVFARR